VLEHNLVLKGDELFLAGEINTDGSGEPATGLYVRDTRHLSRFRLTLNGEPLDRLSARVTGARTATVVEANRPLPQPDGSLLTPHTIAVEQEVELGTAATVRLCLANHANRPVSVQLAVRLAADFRDLFDIRGFPREIRGDVLPPAPADDGLSALLAYRGLDGQRAETVIRLDRPALLEVVPADDEPIPEAAVLLPGYDAVTVRLRPPIPPSLRASFDLDLATNERWELTVTIEPRPAGDTPVSALATLPDGKPPRLARIASDNPFFDRFLARCAADLTALQTSFPEGSLPAAGIPWYVAPFGRDSLIVGLQTYHSAPKRAEGTLRVLAALQGDQEDPERHHGPGKILHEVRYGEVARLGEKHHTPYYGSVDSTPLWLLLFAETVAWTGDDRLWSDLLPNARKAIAWIERWGDRDGDGLVEYRARPADGKRIVHQGWKDSHDSLHHPDGRPVDGEIALVEVQGYVFAAYRRLAEVAAVRGDHAWAAELRAKAEAIRQTVEAGFWLDGEGFYAQALDSGKRPVAAISSNTGHLLFCGLPTAERGSLVAARFRRPDLDSGWGIRTLSARMPTYNPMSYHNGSVWPHDNSLIADGLRRYGDVAGAHRIAAALFAAAEADPLSRLPELYCGFARGDRAAGDAPVAYPVSCSPQAWAAGAGRLLARTMLGLRVDVERKLLLADPALPPWLGELRAEGVEVLGTEVSLRAQRHGSGASLEATGPVLREALPVPRPALSSLLAGS